MGRTACTEPQCLYKGALYLTSVPVQGCTLPYLFTYMNTHLSNKPFRNDACIQHIRSKCERSVWL